MMFVKQKFFIMGVIAFTAIPGYEASTIGLDRQISY